MLDEHPEKVETPKRTPKSIVFDFSWVLLHPKDREYNGSLNGLNKEKGGGDPMGQYNFFDYFEFNSDLYRYITALKEKTQLPIYIFTTDIIQERPELQEYLGVFDRVISGRDIVEKKAGNAATLDAVKTDPASYQYIAGELQLDPHDLLFIDDKAENVAAAGQVGYQTVRYEKLPTMTESNNALFQRLDPMFGINSQEILAQK